LFIVPTKTDEEKLKEKLVEWNATYVQNSAQFKPNQPEQVAIEINNLLSDQNNHQTTKIIPQPTAKIVETTLELSSQTLSKPTLEENNNSFESKIVEVSLDGLEKERLMLKFVGEGWYFRLKEVKNKNYFCARKSTEEYSFGLFTDEIKYIAEKNKIEIKRYKEKLLK
ncbi:MAG: hypothetical protein LBB87_03630, partial [Nitrososphaerota archaeon]|nr:hypothetical protein [Nitrososphaerota archaeon]